MGFRRRYFLKISVMALFAALIVGSVYAGDEDDLDSILARHLEALGGRERLVSINSITATASLTVNDIAGKQISYQKFPSKYYIRFDQGQLSQTVGFDGLVGWLVDGNGIARTQTAEERKPLVNEVYFQSYSYLIKTGHSGRIEYHGISLFEEQPYYQLLLFPAGGDSLYLLINQETNLVEYRMESNFGTNLITRYSDYRNVDGLMVPFLSKTTATNVPLSTVGRIESIEINSDLDDSLFSMPGTVGNDFAFPGGADSIVIRFQLEGNHIYLPVKINGRDQFRFLLDSGAGGIVISQKAADQIGLQRLGDLPARGLGGFGSFGLTQIDSLNISTLSLYIKNVMISNLEVGRGANKWSIDGILGYDFFARFPIAINFDRGELTIYKPPKTRSGGDGHKIDVEIFSQLPIASVKLDRFPVRVAIDLGSQAALVIQPSARFHREISQIIDSASQLYSIGGVGGVSRLRGGRMSSLSLGDETIDSPLVLLSEDFSSAPLPTYIEGLIGMEILKRFNLYIDYPAREIYFLRRE